MHVEYNASRAIAILVTTALLLNTMMPTLAHAAIDLAEVNANTLVRDAYVAVTYYDSKGKQKLAKGWIDEVGETSFTIRSGGIKDKKTISYDKVVSVFISEETNTLKQMNEVNRFIGEKKEEEKLRAITIMSDGQIDLSKIRKGWYALVIYTSEGEEDTVTGRITRQDSVHIVIRVQEERALRILKTIAYKDIDTLVISQYARSIEAWKNGLEQLGTKKKVANKWGAGFLGGALLGVAGGALIGGPAARNCTGEWCGIEYLWYGYLGYVFGVPIGVGIVEMDHPLDLILPILGSVTGAGAGWVITSSSPRLWPSVLIGPLVGAVMMSELSNPLNDRRFSVGLAPNSDGKLSAIATLRF